MQELNADIIVLTTISNNFDLNLSRHASSLDLKHLKLFPLGIGNKWGAFGFSLFSKKPIDNLMKKPESDFRPDQPYPRQTSFIKIHR
jgi:hypothetical protein